MTSDNLRKSEFDSFDESIFLYRLCSVFGATRGKSAGMIGEVEIALDGISYGECFLIDSDEQDD